MARGLNKVMLIGNLGDAPESRYTGSGQSVCNFSVATSESWKDKDSGETKEKTEWHRIVAWGKLADICTEYLQKGSKVYLEGRLQTRKWQDKDGNDKYTTEIVCDTMLMLGSKPGDSSGPSQNGDRGKAKKSAPKEQDEFVDDDIPF